jgi:hypothetical protein
VPGLRARTRFVRRYVRTNAIRRGLLGRDRLWMTIFVIGLLGRQANKVLKRGDAPLVFSERLQPGESFVITHFAEPGRGRRR